MTPSPVAMRLALLVLLALSVGAPAFGAERETGPDAAAAAAAPAAMVPAPTVAFDASAGRLLPADAVLLATLAPPPAPALATGGAVLLQGGPPPPQLRYYALDALGSVRVTFDTAGNVIGRADYEPFGAAVPASTTGTQPRQQFTGQERDGEVGVDYFGARMYLPRAGRMLSVDPVYLGAIAQPQRWNRYVGMINSPLVLIDPDGRQAQSPDFRSVTVEDCGGTCFPLYYWWFWLWSPGWNPGGGGGGGGGGGNPNPPGDGPSESFSDTAIGVVDDSFVTRNPTCRTEMVTTMTEVSMSFSVFTLTGSVGAGVWEQKADTSFINFNPTGVFTSVGWGGTLSNVGRIDQASRGMRPIGDAFKGPLQVQAMYTRSSLTPAKLMSETTSFQVGGVGPSVAGVVFGSNGFAGWSLGMSTPGGPRFSANLGSQMTEVFSIGTSVEICTP